MQLTEAILQALHAAWSHKLRSFFTLLGIIVSVAFLVAVVAVIQGMNAYVRERIGGAIVGVNAFQVRRTPIAVGLIDDEQWKEIQRRPIIAPEDVHYVERALPDAKAIALQSGWPTPQADVVWRNKTVGDVFVFGVTAPFQLVQDHQFAAGDPLTDIDVRERRPVVELGYDIADKLFEGNVALAVGQRIRILGQQYLVKGVVAKKGTVLGQSWDGFVMLPLTSIEALYGRRKTTVISGKMSEATLVQPGMRRAGLARRHGARRARERPVAPARARHGLVGRRRAGPVRERRRDLRCVSGRAGRAPGSGGGVEVRMKQMRSAECGMRSSTGESLAARSSPGYSAFRTPHSALRRAA